MNKVAVNFKTDAATKEAAQKLADDLGLTLSALINTQLKQLINERRVLLQAPYPTMPVSQKLAQQLDEVEKEVAAGQVSRPHTDLKQLARDLRDPSD